MIWKNISLTNGIFKKLTISRLGYNSESHNFQRDMLVAKLHFMTAIMVCVKVFVFRFLQLRVLYGRSGKWLTIALTKHVRTFLLTLEM